MKLSVELDTGIITALNRIVLENNILDEEEAIRFLCAFYNLYKERIARYESVGRFD
jgi:hypothetical protein